MTQPTFGFWFRLQKIPAHPNKETTAQSPRGEGPSFSRLWGGFSSLSQGGPLGRVWEVRPQVKCQELPG